LSKGVRDPFQHWDELSILFSSPYLNLQCEIEEGMDEHIGSVGSRSETSLVPGRGKLQGGILLDYLTSLTRMRDSLKLEISEDTIIRILRLRYGPKRVLNHSL
jgi:hypothetical protein